KFAGADWAESLIGLLGGIELVRTIHHICAVILILASIYHVVVVAYKVFVLRVRWTMFPRVDDVLDALDAVRYNLGLTKEQPRSGRYNYAEKVEYWALVWGTIIMAATGFIMWNPIYATRFVSGEIIPAAKAAHGAEAILAVLAIVIWHFYGVHIKSFSKAMFDGKLSAHQMEEEHPLELERIEQGKTDPRPSADVVKKRERLFIPIAAVATVVTLATLFFFVTHQEVALATVPRRVQQVQIYVPLTPTPFVPGGATPASSSAPTAAQLPADHAGRTTCLACHANGVGPALPADHSGRTDATCSGCHKFGDSANGEPTGTPAAGAEGTVAAPASPSSSAGTALVLPADHAGRTICLGCHANGVGPALPADHAGRTDSVCLTCHKEP
ncbi:MAG: hypothetical protein M1482_05490, partial [Chloroflexi bacterium]|nr:hypothetical protein [Chloroflexota bacterium]